MAGAGPTLGFPVSSIPDLPDVVSRDSVLNCQFSSWGRRRSDLRNLLFGEFRPATTAQIFYVGHGFQVFWTNARTVVAKVVYLQAFWDRTKGTFVSHAMRCLMSPEVAVSLPVYVTVPDKARGGESAVTLVPQIFAPRGPLKSPRVPAQKASRASLEKIRGLSTSTLAELPTRLKAHVGLLHRLTLGAGPAPRPCHSIGSHS